MRNTYIYIYTRYTMVCKAEVSINTTYKEYYGGSEGEFKSRYKFVD